MKQNEEKTDIIVIGGGPGGSTVAALLAQQGLPVVLFERDVFPRFHIGESLLPASLPIFDELGVSRRGQTSIP
jgi:2-polyprenyl-6-methoxyphenol hydroxylase-like FAD-dependent oxidoreductase